MNFGFNADQKSLGDTIAQRLRDFPALLNPDPAEALDAEVWDALTDLGLFCLILPENDGGVGLSLVDIALGCEALGASLAPLIVSSTLIASDIIVRFGSATQKADLLPAIASGEVKIAIAVLEAEQGYDPEDVQTAVSAGRLNGRKILVGGGQDADVFLTLVSHNDRPALYLVDRKAGGVTVRPHSDLDASSGLCEIVFDAVSVTDAPLGAPVTEGAVERLVDAGSAVYAAMQVGIAARMLDASVEYAKTREQFGRPIGSFQSIKHRCADAAVALEAGRSAAYYAVWALAEDAPDRARACSMAKAYCGEVSRDVCNEAIQIHGGMGFTWELGLHRFLRRAKVMEHAFGNQVWHYERVLTATLTTQRMIDTHGRDAA